MAEKSSGGAKPIRISDVAKPGKSAPSASSKPIIVTNRPVLRDPMMAAASTEQGEKESGGPAQPLSHLKIGPLDDAAKQQLDKPDTKNDKDTPADDSKSDSKSDAKSKEVTDETTETSAKSESESKPEASDAEAKSGEESKPEASSPVIAQDNEDPDAEPVKEAAPTDDSSTADEGDEDGKPAPVNPNAEADQAAADIRAKELEDLAESRKFYLPINQVEKRKAKRYAWAGALLIILLAVAWADVAADAGLITIPGVKPVTHFFSK